MQTRPKNFRTRTRALLPLAFVCIASFSLTAPSVVSAHGRSHERRSDSHEGRNRSRDESRSRFTHSAEGRHFDNGVTLRRSVPVVDRRFDAYFPHHYYSYPHYAIRRDSERIVCPIFCKSSRFEIEQTGFYRKSEAISNIISLAYYGTIGLTGPSVPEPSCLAVGVIGLASVGLMLRRRRMS